MEGILAVRRDNAHIIKLHSKNLIVSGESGAWLICDDSCVDIFKDLIQPKAYSDLIEKYPSQVVTDSLNLLLDSDLLEVNQNKVLPAKFENLIDQIEEDAREVILNLTHGCNLRCGYCYLSATKGPIMDQTVAKIAIDKTLLQNDTHFRFDLHGGEPTIAWGLVNFIVKYTKSKAEELKKIVEFTITTNATLLDKKKIEFLKDNDISVGVSLDGPEHIHDSNRYFASGNGSFKKTMTGVQHLLDAGIKLHVLSVITDPAKIPEIFDFFISKGIYKMRFNPYVKQGRASDPMMRKDEQELFAKNDLIITKKAIQLIKSKNLKIRLLHIDSMLRSLFSYEQLEFCRSPKGAGCRMIAVLPDGDILPCNCLTGTPNIDEFKIGNISSTGSIHNIISSNKPILSPNQRNVNNIAKCSKCAWKKTCGGGDFNESYQAFGVLDREAYMCRYYELMYPELVWLYSNDPKGIISLMIGSGLFHRAQDKLDI
jgi:uncharacterized protein